MRSPGKSVVAGIMALGLLAASGAAAGPVRDLSVPMASLPGYDPARLVGDWFEVAQTPSLLERDCHGTTVTVAPRDDSRLTMKIACHVGSVAGKVLPIDGVMAETGPAVFQVRLVHLSDLGNLTLVVIWQAADDSMVVLGAPKGEIGWIWSRSAAPDAALLAEARQALVAAGYRETAIRAVDQGQ